MPEQDTQSYDPAKAIGPDGRSYQQYLDERKLLLDSERSAADNFDKMLLTLSAGSIALSVTFVEKIGAAGVAKPLLYISWLILAIGLVINLRSFMVLQASINRVIQINDDMFESGNCDTTNPHQPRIKLLNRWAFGLFVLGIALLLAFAAVNYQAAKPTKPEEVVIVMSEDGKITIPKARIEMRRASEGASPVKLPPTAPKSQPPGNSPKPTTPTTSKK